MALCITNSYAAAAALSALRSPSQLVNRATTCFSLSPVGFRVDSRAPTFLAKEDFVSLNIALKSSTLSFSLAFSISRMRLYAPGGSPIAMHLVFVIGSERLIIGARHVPLRGIISPGQFIEWYIPGPFVLSRRAGHGHRAVPTLAQRHLACHLVA